MTTQTIDTAERIAAKLGMSSRTVKAAYSINTDDPVMPFITEISSAYTNNTGDLMMCGHVDYLLRTASMLVCGDEKRKVVEFKPGREFFLADMYWLPPDGDPIGPMAFEATCSLHGDGTLLKVRQSGCDETSERWSRYYEIISTGWTLALAALKKHLEEKWHP